MNNHFIVQIEANCTGKILQTMNKTKQTKIFSARFRGIDIFYLNRYNQILITVILAKGQRSHIQSSLYLCMLCTLIHMYKIVIHCFIWFVCVCVFLKPIYSALYSAFVAVAIAAICIHAICR